MVCSYGCGRKAKYIFKNGKFCCSKTQNKCPEIRRKNSETNKIKQSGKNNGMFGKKHSKKTREKMSINHADFSGENNPKGMLGKHHSEEVKEKQRRYMLNGGAAYVISHLKTLPKSQIKLYKIVKEIFPEAKLNYPIYEVNRVIDIAIPSKMIAIEHDGFYHNYQKEEDKIRQKQLEKLGWRFIRYKEYIPDKNKLLKDIGELF